MQAAEISYDLVMEPEMGFVEGTFRLMGGPWQVFIFSRKEVAEAQWRGARWESGVGGIVVEYPLAAILNQEAVEGVLSAALGVSEWSEVRGPDSMDLR